MAINPEIRDQAYQFFIEEVPELLQAIETGLLTLREERSTRKVHNVMRAAHSIKGGAASVGLDAIKTIAHRLESLFKGLYNESLELDTDLETQLLQAYDCLRVPLTEQIETGEFDTNKAISQAEQIFTPLEIQLREFLKETEDFIPSSEDLGIDMVASLFEVDVRQGLERWASVLADPDEYEVKGELQTQLEVFGGFAELLSLPGFGDIATTATQALRLAPENALEILSVALTDFEAGCEAVLAGDRTRGGKPSDALLTLASEHQPIVSSEAGVTLDILNDVETQVIDELFESNLDDSSSIPVNKSIPDFDSNSLGEVVSLEDVFGDSDFVVDSARELELASTESEKTDEIQVKNPSLEDIFDIDALNSENSLIGDSPATPPSLEDIVEISSPLVDENDSPEFSTLQVREEPDLSAIDEAIESAESIFDQLPSVVDEPASIQSLLSNSSSTKSSDQSKSPKTPQSPKQVNPSPQPGLTVRIGMDRLDRMNNLIGELVINRNSLSLQNEQLQRVVKELLVKFERFNVQIGGLQNLSDQMLVEPGSAAGINLPHIEAVNSTVSNLLSGFDSLEMDRYNSLQTQLQSVSEDVMQLEEFVGDINLFTTQTNQTLASQRQQLNQLRDELMWARMLPLGNVLSRFPRIIRDLATQNDKLVNLQLRGSNILVDKVVIEKLYDPLLHILRNAFDHGIESPEIRKQYGKPDTGQITVDAYYQGNQTYIEIQDDGKGLDIGRIKERVVSLGWASTEELASGTENSILEYIFEPGFSTAEKVSELSGRGVGLDAVREQIRALKGTVEAHSNPGQGTKFTLRLPLTLSVSQLLVTQVGPFTLALPSDNIEDILIPQPEQLKRSQGNEFLHWNNQLIPIYSLKSLLNYACVIPEATDNQAFHSVPTPEGWSFPLLIIQNDKNYSALQVELLLTEQELVVKPFGGAVSAPPYTYGCTILGDGSLVPVIDAKSIIQYSLKMNDNSHRKDDISRQKKEGPKTNINRTTDTIMVVDDSSTLRRTLALTLQKFGFQVVQASDGREALFKLQQSSNIKLVICDIEMPNMNGFEFLTQRRLKSELLGIPVIMLSSRSSQKHQQMAQQLKANAYFTKPYIEQELVTAVRDMMNATHV